MTPPSRKSGGEAQIQRELREFAAYCDLVAADSVGLQRATWTERGRWITSVADAYVGAVDLLREVATSGVAQDDERLRYVEIQVDHGTWKALAPYRDEGGSDGR